MSVEAWQLRSNNLFFFSSCFSLSSPQESCWPAKKKNISCHLFFFNQICSLLFWLLFFFWIILLIDFFNFIHLYLISFNFYINFDPRSFYYDFLIDLFFLFSSLNIQFHFIFISNLFLSFRLLFVFFSFLIDCFFFQFHPSIFYWLRI
jgi:hypothetical protein